MAEAPILKNPMTSKTRLTVLLVSTPIIVFVLLGGFLNRVLADQDTSYQPLRVFEDVVSLVMNNYVEKVNNERIMRGALQGLAEGLDADSAWLTPAAGRRGRPRRRRRPRELSAWSSRVSTTCASSRHATARRRPRPA